MSDKNKKVKDDDMDSVAGGIGDVHATSKYGDVTVEEHTTEIQQGDRFGGDKIGGITRNG